MKINLGKGMNVGVRFDEYGTQDDWMVEMPFLSFSSLLFLLLRFQFGCEKFFERVNLPTGDIDTLIHTIRSAHQQGRIRTTLILIKKEPTNNMREETKEMRGEGVEESEYSLWMNLVSLPQS